MAKIVILGTGISGHTAAAHLRRKLAKEHEVLVVSPNLYNANALTLTKTQHL